MKIIPIVEPKIDWHDYVKGVESLTGSSPTRLLDNANIPVGDYPSYIKTLSIFEANDLNSTKISYLDHLYFSFLIESCYMSHIYNLVSTRLKFIEHSEDKLFNKIAIFTGSLRDWLEFCNTYSKPPYYGEIRLIFSNLNSYFAALGFNSNIEDV